VRGKRMRMRWDHLLNFLKGLLLVVLQCQISTTPPHPAIQLRLPQKISSSPPKTHPIRLLRASQIQRPTSTDPIPITAPQVTTLQPQLPAPNPPTPKSHSTKANTPPSPHATPLVPPSLPPQQIPQPHTTVPLKADTRVPTAGVCPQARDIVDQA